MPLGLGRVRPRVDQAREEVVGIVNMVRCNHWLQYMSWAWGSYERCKTNYPIYCCLCKRSSRQTTLVCVNAPHRNELLPLPLHLAAEIMDTCFPSLYINIMLAQIDNINQSFLCALWLCSPHEQNILRRLVEWSLVSVVSVTGHVRELHAPWRRLQPILKLALSRLSH
jgi:hypothetical protein